MFHGCFIIVIFVFVCIPVISGKSRVRGATFAKHRNRLNVEESEVVLYTTARSATQCSLLCWHRHPQCQSIRYDKLSKSCELLTNMEPTEGNIGNAMYTLTPAAKDCSEIGQNCKHAHSGVYMIGNNHTDKWSVYCDMDTDGGGWTRREDSSVSFTKSWVEYKDGFGSKCGEFWLGNEIIHRMTSSGEYRVRFDLVTSGTGEDYFAIYDSFRIEDEGDGYRMEVGIKLNDNTGDVLRVGPGKKFSTYDVDNDNKASDSCSNGNGGGWWFGACFSCPLNGYGTGFKCTLNGIMEMLSSSEIKIKRD